jgi:hypothetical protein
VFGVGSIVVAFVMCAASALHAGAEQAGVQLADDARQTCQVRIADGYSLFEVSGTLTTLVSEDGSKKRPIRRLEVFSGDYTNGRVAEPLTRVRASVSRSGQFRFKARARFNVVESCRGSTRTRQESNETAHYLLRAPGCDDLALEVSVGWQPREVVLSCRAPK